MYNYAVRVTLFAGDEVLEVREVQVACRTAHGVTRAIRRARVQAVRRARRVWSDPVTRVAVHVIDADDAVTIFGS